MFCICNPKLLFAMNTFFNNRYFNWSLLISYVLLLSYLSLMNTHELHVGFLNFAHADKLVHFALYFIFAGLLFRVLYISFLVPINIQAIISIAIPVVYGGLIELTQEYLVSGRTADVFDFLANIAGIAIGVYTSWLLIKFGFDRYYVKELS